MLLATGPGRRLWLWAVGIGLALLLALPLGLLAAGAGIGGDPTGGGTTACAPALSLGTGAIGWPMRPGSYTLTSPYGPRWGTFHYGQDLGAPDGTPIYAAADGVVRKAGPASGFGLWVVLDHQVDGQLVSTVYGHMNAGGIQVAEGQHVTAGQQIALVGHNGEATGPHLHFEVWPGGRLDGGHAVDPMGWLDSNATSTGPATSSAGPVPVTVAQPVTGAPPAQGTQARMPVGAEQQHNVGIIVGVVKGRGLPLYAAVVAVATAEQESSLRVLAYGDAAGPDSRGLFQQRTGWGPLSVRMDPAGSTGLFLDALAKVPGWAGMPLTQAAQAVQHSGLPTAYARWQVQATELVAAAAGVDPITAGLGQQPSPCGVNPAT